MWEGFGGLVWGVVANQAVGGLLVAMVRLLRFLSSFLVCVRRVDSNSYCVPLCRSYAKQTASQRALRRQ